MANGESQTAGLRPVRPAGYRLVGAVTLILFAALVVSLSGGVAGQGRPGPATGEGLWIQAIPQDDRITLLVADPSARSLAVYHVDPAGSLTLRSSRDISWDLLLGDFNAQEPSPSVIRGMLERAPAPGVRSPRP